MKKIGILTLYYKTFNYGAQLQSFALQKVIQNMGYECEQISFLWSNLQTVQNYQNFSIDVEKFEEFSNEIPHSEKIYTPQNIAECVEKYDGFVCGSDQIWGVSESMPLYVMPQITLSFVPDDKIKIAYAASLGGSRISDERMNSIKSSISRLDAVSVRESDAVLEIQKLTKKEVVNVLDPVMLLDTTIWDKVAKKIQSDEEFLLVYCINQNKEILELSDKIAKEKKLKIISLAYIQGEKVGLREFVGFIKNAKYIITDSFHATVFSILYKKKFICFPVDNLDNEFSKNIRMKNLLKNFGILDRFCKDSNKGIEKLLNEEIEYNEVHKKLEILKENSLTFISSELSREKKILDKLAKKNECTGCESCVQVCPNESIWMKTDQLGFEYPSINNLTCTECGLCTKACPILNKNKNNDSINKCYLIQNKNEKILKISSSGGLFYELANKMLSNNGLVYGAIYDEEFFVKHEMCNSISNLPKLCKSKYVQSKIGNSYKEIKNQLEKNKEILFVGTPCQVEGLKTFLKKDYENLFLVDFICGGVTSPKLWENYYNHISKKDKVKSLSMRNKSRGFLNSNGYPNFSMEIVYENVESEIIPRNEDYFLNVRFGFYRENCYNCKYKKTKHSSDLTLGDFCGINTYLGRLDDGKGSSLLIIQNDKGRKFFADIENKFYSEEFPIEVAINTNPMLIKNMEKPFYYNYVRDILEEHGIEKLFYEIKYFNEFYMSEQIKKDLWYEIIRNELFIRLTEFNYFNLYIENIPLIKGDVIIYGAGKLGRLLLDSMKTNPLCYIDESGKIENCLGVNVYKLKDERLKKILEQENEKTIIITPVWDFYEIKSNIKKIYGNINCISLKEVLKNI